MINYVFDVDGTLTPSRGQMNQEFKDFFLDFAFQNEVYLVTGSDHLKTVEQVGAEVTERVNAVYNCSGNNVWSKGQEIIKSDWSIDKEIRNWLTKKLEKSVFPFRSGNHIEERIGLVNFSIIGRNCTLGERKMYVQYDEQSNERKILAEEFNEKFFSKNVVAQVAGETGLDIMEIGSDKGQIVKYIQQPIHFFGDKMQEGGNDYPLRIMLGKNSEWTEVSSWKDTFEILKKKVYN